MIETRLLEKDSSSITNISMSTGSTLPLSTEDVADPMMEKELPSAELDLRTPKEKSNTGSC